MGFHEPIPKVAAADPSAGEKPGGFLQPIKDGWRLGGVALDFVIAHRQLWRYVLVAAVAVLVSGAVVGALADVLRRHAGVLVDALAGLGAYYYFGPPPHRWASPDW
jgi:hypothetical protein